jgi:hypothetical protein
MKLKVNKKRIFNVGFCALTKLRGEIYMVYYPVTKFDLAFYNYLQSYDVDKQLRHNIAHTYEDLCCLLLQEIKYGDEKEKQFAYWKRFGTLKLYKKLNKIIFCGIHYPDDRPIPDREKYSMCSTCGYKWLIKYDKELGHHCPKCSLSFHAKIIASYLDEHNYKYILEYIYPDLMGDKYNLRFDFAILDKNEKIMGLIEYDGRQHSDTDYQFSRLVEINHNKINKYDEKKNKYCCDHNIPLLRINYKQIFASPDILNDYIKYIKNNPKPKHTITYQVDDKSFQSYIQFEKEMYEDIEKAQKCKYEISANREMRYDYQSKAEKMRNFITMNLIKWSHSDVERND